jgi:hypothetical protein
MRFMTAIGRNRIERQQYCIGTWKPFADEIVACNTAVDIEFLKPHFPDVRFETCPPHLTGEKLYGRPDRVTIYALAQCGPGLLINSDIKIDGITPSNFASAWKPVDRKLKIGLRYDYDGPKKPKTMNKYGIDAFLLTEQIIDRIPNLGFVIGTSVWDYWLTWHMVAKQAYYLQAIHGHLLHLNHVSSWNEEDTKIGESLMDHHYAISRKTLSAAIQVLTSRR